MNLSGKVALVTGGARGIGLAYSRALLEKSTKICIADINIDEGRQALSGLSELYGKENVKFLKCDVTNETEFENTFLKCKKEFEGKVDILVNNAGICNELDWKRMIDINIKGVVNGCHLAFKHLGKEGDDVRGVIVNTASIGGVLPSFMIPVYIATKHAIVGLTRSYGDPIIFAKHRVKINSVCPSITDTSLLKDIKASSWITGEESKNSINSMPIISTEKPAEALIRILEEGVNGRCILVGPFREAYYVNFPNYLSSKKDKYIL